MNSIQDQNKKTPDKNKSYLNKSVGVVSNFLKGWINWFSFLQTDYLFLFFTNSNKVPFNRCKSL